MCAPAAAPTWVRLPDGSAVVRRIIAPDNSCLFNAVGYVMEGSRAQAPKLRYNLMHDAVVLPHVALRCINTCSGAHMPTSNRAAEPDLPRGIIKQGTAVEPTCQHSGADLKSSLSCCCHRLVTALQQHGGQQGPGPKLAGTLEAPHTRAAPCCAAAGAQSSRLLSTCPSTGAQSAVAAWMCPRLSATTMHFHDYTGRQQIWGVAQAQQVRSSPPLPSLPVPAGE